MANEIDEKRRAENEIARLRDEFGRVLDCMRPGGLDRAHALDALTTFARAHGAREMTAETLRLRQIVVMHLLSEASKATAPEVRSALAGAARDLFDTFETFRDMMADALADDANAPPSPGLGS